MYLNNLEQPPENTNDWIKKNIVKMLAPHESEEETDKEYILSTKDNKYSNYYGTVLSEHQKNKILGETDKKLRFCIVTGLKRKENMQKDQRNVWIPERKFTPRIWITTRKPGQ